MTQSNLNILKRLRFLCTKEMYDDLCFYLDHETELYFSGMFKIAVIQTTMTIIFLVLGFLAVVIGINYLMGILCFGIAYISTLGFGTTKMYLHVRKDAIEIKEMLISIAAASGRE
jgi:hypothetical protein